MSGFIDQQGGMNPLLMQLLQAYTGGTMNTPSQNSQPQNPIGPAWQQVDDLNQFLTPGLKSYIPDFGVRAPWLTAQDGLDVNTLMQYADAGHPVALQEIANIRARQDQWTAPDQFNPNGKDATQNWLNYAPGTSMEDIMAAYNYKPGVPGRTSIGTTPGSLLPDIPKLPGLAPPPKPNLLQAGATQVGQPNPMDRVLGGPAGMNPFKPKKIL